METKTITSIDELKTFAQEFLNSLTITNDRATVIALSGDLGAGKTTFVQQLALLLGVVEPVTSPTFTIMKRYETTDDRITGLLHMDAYRLESEDELGPLRFAELLAQGDTLFCIEWADRITNALPADVIRLNFEITEGENRTIQID